jgi:8-oxo-dGTP diphosphatase
MNPHTKPAVVAYVVRDNKLLLGKRLVPFGYGKWGMPGGHLEFMEPAVMGALRDLEEETGIVAIPEAAELVAVTETITPEENKHYLHLAFKVDIGSSEPVNTEPEACEGWQWFDLDNLPEGILEPHAEILRTIQSGRVYNV